MKTMKIAKTRNLRGGKGVKPRHDRHRGSKDCSKLESVPIVDAAVAYDCPYTMQTFILTMHNALYFPSMAHNLVPPFIMREAGLVVNDVPRINTSEEDLNNETHCIVANEASNGARLKIPLQMSFQT